MSKNYCHLKPRCVKCAGDCLTKQCHRKERSSEVRCVPCDGNHPANYKGCRSTRTYKRKHTHLSLNISSTNQTYPTHSTKQNSYSPTNVEQEPHIPTTHLVERQYSAHLSAHLNDLTVNLIELPNNRR
jgi:hypothetical protein